MMASRSKGVQMVSEMRARVKNLEQKIHTRVPRLRLGSNAGRQGTNTSAVSTTASTSTTSSTPGPKNIVTRSAMPDSKFAKPSLQRHGVDTGSISGATTPNGDNSGWVLIMDETPSPIKVAEKERRRSSSPSAPSAFRHGIPTSATSPTFPKPNIFAQSHSRRPQSRLSGASLSTTATISSIPTPSSRPATPTFLPLPTSGPYSNTGGIGIKRSTGPGAGAYSQSKRSSISSSNTGSPTPSDGDFRSRERPFSYNGKAQSDLKTLPPPPLPHSNVTVRASSRIPSSPGASVLSQSRIGRPAVNGSRKSVGLEPTVDNGGFLDDKKSRVRSGSNTFGLGRGSGA